MSAVIYAWPRHLRANCPAEGCHYDGPGDCVHVAFFCCKRCGGAEGDLPTDCPGEWMGGRVRDQIMAGDLNYTRAAGWVQPGDIQWRRN